MVPTIQFITNQYQVQVVQAHQSRIGMWIQVPDHHGKSVIFSI